jgi:ankyrin repeat protein
VERLTSVRRMGPWRAVLLCAPFTIAGLFFLLTRQDRLDAALGDAVMQEDVERVRALLDEGANARGVVQDRPSATQNPLLSSSDGRRGAMPSTSRLDTKTGMGHYRKRTLLMAAADASDEGTLRALLDRGAEPNYALDDGRTALFLCAKHDSPECLGVLLEHGASVGDRDKAGQTPLHLAARSNAASNIQTLLDHGSDLRAKDANGQTPLAVAAAYHAEKAVCALIARGADRSELIARGYDPPLVWAASAGPLSLVHEIWQRELSGKQRKAQSPAALFHAVRSDNVPAVQYLLRQGVSPNPEPMDLTVRRRQVGQSAMAPRPRTTRTTILLAAIAAGDLKLFDLLLANGANPNAVDSRGDAPLMLLARGATHPIVLSGLTRNRTPKIRLAASLNPSWYRSIELLLDRGADVRATDVSGQTALMFCVRDAYLADLLIQKGANVNAKDRMGRTALMCACESRTATVERLLSAGARVNDRDANGADALMYAMRTHRSGETERTADLLLRHGAVKAISPMPK